MFEVHSFSVLIEKLQNQLYDSKGCEYLNSILNGNRKYMKQYDHNIKLFKALGSKRNLQYSTAQTKRTLYYQGLSELSISKIVDSIIDLINSDKVYNNMDMVFEFVTSNIDCFKIINFKKLDELCEAFEKYDMFGKSFFVLYKFMFDVYNIAHQKEQTQNFNEKKKYFEYKLQGLEDLMKMQNEMEKTKTKVFEEAMKVKASSYSLYCSKLNQERSIKKLIQNGKKTKEIEIARQENKPFNIDLDNEEISEEDLDSINIDKFRPIRKDLSDRKSKMTIDCSDFLLTPDIKPKPIEPLAPRKRRRTDNGYKTKQIKRQKILFN